MRKAIQVNTDLTTIDLDLDAPEGSLQTLQTAVGGYIEGVRLSDSMELWLNEEGLYMCPDLNPFATLLYRQTFKMDNPIMGNVVFTGGSDYDGNLEGLTEQQATLIRDAVAFARIATKLAV